MKVRKGVIENSKKKKLLKKTKKYDGAIRYGEAEEWPFSLKFAEENFHYNPCCKAWIKH